MKKKVKTNDLLNTNGTVGTYNTDFMELKKSPFSMMSIDSQYSTKNETINFPSNTFELESKPKGGIINFQSMGNNGSNTSKNNSQNSLTQDVKQDCWRLGVLVKKDCYYVILEILKCLELMGFEWKLVSSSYKIKCRRKNEDSSNGKGLNVLIQVFGVSYFLIYLLY